MTPCAETLCLVQEGFGNYAGMTPSEAKGNVVVSGLYITTLLSQ